MNAQVPAREKGIPTLISTLLKGLANAILDPVLS